MYIYNLTYFIILLHYFIANIYMRVFFIVYVYIYVCFKGCHVIVICGPYGQLTMWDTPHNFARL